jgi:DNA-binding MarR family transcriptional regulator
MQALGAGVTQVEIAKNAERKPGVISRHLATMPKDGLITKSHYKKSLML